jgi:hypothetical protein
MWMRKKRKAAVPSVEQAGEAARRLADELLAPIVARAPEALPQAVQAVTGAGREVGPAVAQVIATVGEAAAGGRRQFAEAAQTVRQQVAPPLTHMTDAVGDTARKAGAGGSALVEDATDAASGAVERLARQREALIHRQQAVAEAINPAAAVEAATSAGRQVQRATGKAAKRAGGFVGDTVGALFWLAAAGALLYYAFASEEQRARVTGAIRTVYEQATELYRDFQGYHDEI